MHPATRIRDGDWRATSRQTISLTETRSDEMLADTALTHGRGRAGTNSGRDRAPIPKRTSLRNTTSLCVDLDRPRARTPERSARTSPRARLPPTSAIVASAGAARETEATWAINAVASGAEASATGTRGCLSLGYHPLLPTRRSTSAWLRCLQAAQRLGIRPKPIEAGFTPAGWNPRLTIKLSGGQHP